MFVRFLSTAFLCLASTAIAADHWTQFRGPEGNGHTSAAGLPLKFSENEHIKWKTPIHGKGWSSPVILGSQIWVTTATEDGTELSLICVDKDSGKIASDQILFRVANPQFCHKFNSYASPTPVIEEGRLYVTYGSPGTACIDTRTGKVLWERRDFVCNHYRGAGSSPILWGDLLIMHFDGSDVQYVVALDKKTGKTVWKTDRSVDFKDLDKDGKPVGEGDLRKAFATPHVIEHGGRPLLLSSGAKAHYGYDPQTGREVWRVEELDQHSASTRPVTAHGLAFFQTGFSKGQLLAVKLPALGKSSDAPTVLGESQLAWRLKRSIPNKPSATLAGDLLFLIDDGGIASCVEAKTGTVIWTQRVEGNYSASPILAPGSPGQAGRLYVCSENGKVAVLAVDREFALLADNQLGDGYMASPAVAGKALFLRSKTHLYRIEE
ncbi:MAG: PQQ-binding-like beta-propeller repeat protein [Verrucomicrobiota bacterium]|nr:PQQ-binding-like beta-propeller repeat protein [Verrucomicrobiota bacterium]